MTIFSDDFELILGIEFFVKAKASLVPHLNRLYIADKKNPYFVPAKYLDKYKGKHVEDDMKSTN